MHQKRITKNPLDFYSLKFTKFRFDNVKNESARTKNQKGGALPASLGLNNKMSVIFFISLRIKCASVQTNCVI